MFKRSVTLSIIAAAGIALAGCAGEYAEVPIAYVGKIKTREGLKPGLVEPSQFRLPFCIRYCDKLLLVEASDFQAKEDFRGENALYMPKSDLTMPFDVRGTFAVARDDERLNRVFANLPAQAVEFSGAHGLISAKQIYDTYAVPIIRDVVRRIVAKYSITEVTSNRAKINGELNDELVKALSDGQISLDVRRFGLADVRFPKIILEQKETAARRRIAIQQEEAEKQIRLVKLQADLEAAKAERAIRREKAQAVLEENKIYAESVTDKYLAYRRLEVLETIAKSDNTKWVPFKALDTVGANVAVFKDAPK